MKEERNTHNKSTPKDIHLPNFRRQTPSIRTKRNRAHYETCVPDKGHHFLIKKNNII